MLVGLQLRTSFSLASRDTLPRSASPACLRSMVDSCVVSNNLSFKHREYIWNSEEDHDGGCDETYQEAKGRTSWAQSSKQCLKSSIIIAGSQGSPTRVPSGQWHCFCPVHFILQLFCVLRASNTVVGPRHVGLPRENGTGGLF